MFWYRTSARLCHFFQEFALGNHAIDCRQIADDGQRNLPNPVPAGEIWEFLYFDNIAGDLGALDGHSMGQKGHSCRRFAGRRYEHLDMHRAVDSPQLLS